MKDHPPTISAKKSLGQHFLNNSRIPALMVEAAHIEPGDRVLEIGPGTGVLTRALLSSGASVIAVEADQRAIEVLNTTFSTEIAGGALTIIHGDIRDYVLKEKQDLSPKKLTKTPLETLGVRAHEYKVVANIPYFLSGLLFRTFLETPCQPSSIVFLVQREVAERIARDAKESILSISVKAYGEPKYVRTVPPGNFTPPPKVDSAIIGIHHISHDRFIGIDETKFFALLHTGFGAKRKQLIGNLSKEYDRDTLKRVWDELNIAPTVRGEDLSVDMWLALAKKLC